MIIATSILSAVICSFTACGSSTNDKGDGGKYDPEAKYIVKDVYNGTHDFTATDTDIPFVKNGKCSYTVVLPENRGAALNRARTELTEFSKRLRALNSVPFPKVFIPTTGRDIYRSAKRRFSKIRA